MPAQLPLDPDNQPMGANLMADGRGAVFRCWAPRAHRIWVSGSFNGWQQDDACEMNRRGDYFSAYLSEIKEGDEYKFFVEGAIGGQYKRDPYSRELSTNPAYPFCNCIVRNPSTYAWNDGDWRPPALNDLIIYQLHVGTFNGPDRVNRVAKFLDVVGKLDYLAALGVNAVQLLPIVEFASGRSRGYEGSDLFSPEMDYCVPSADVPDYLPLVNGLRGRAGMPPLGVDDLTPQANQLKAVIDLFHRWGIAVILDLVYNHVGGQIAGQAESFWNFEQAEIHSDDDSSYNSSRDHTGPCFALWKEPVRQFLIDNALSFLREFHVDGFRYDQVSAIVSENNSHGWSFCQALTGTVRAERESSGQIAEYWNVDPYVVRDAGDNGAGFDACLHDSLRSAVRDALSQTAYGASPGMARIARALWPTGFSTAWNAVHCIESHDEVDFGRGERIPKLADPGNPRSWWARSRARVANALLFTAPGIPMIFMGQEFLEDKQWSNDPVWQPGNLIWWDGLDYGKDPVQARFHRFMEALIWFRRRYDALRSETLSVLHVSEENRVLAFHRWVPGVGKDLVILASLNDTTLAGYELAWPSAGTWREIFNSDAYDDYPANGNGGWVDVAPAPRDGFAASARLTLPSNSLIVFARAD